MRVVLINPASYEGKGALVQHRSHAGRAAPLGLRVVAALTPPQHWVEIHEESLLGVRLPDHADLVGIHLTTVNAVRGYEIADSYRARGVPVVLGGVHASLAPEEAGAHADAVVVGEAEPVWPAE